MSDQSPLVSAIDTEIAEILERREQIQQEIAERKALISEADRQVSKLNRMRRDLTGEPQQTRRKREMSPATVAGPKAVAAVETLLRKVGKLKQRDIVEQTGLNSGTVSYALRALQDEKKARRTGIMFGRSPEWEIASGKSTRVRPGS